MSVRRLSGKSSQDGPALALMGGSVSRCSGQASMAPMQAFHARAVRRRVAFFDSSTVVSTR